mmetsp:Transcript_5764/g.22434  ORF Transcript_5764/g.22434 Transcript_5764/m.22434 type:complete len:219 (-) Transcript_5764:55-711(-)
MALAWRRAPAVCRATGAGPDLGLGFPAAARVGARAARDRRALGHAGGGAHLRGLGGARDRASAHLLPAAGRCEARAAAARRRRLVLRMERTGDVLAAGRRHAPAGARGLELSTTAAGRRAAGRLRGVLRARAELRGRRPAGAAAAGRLLWRLDHTRPGRPVQGRSRQRWLVAAPRFAPRQRCAAAGASRVDHCGCAASSAAVRSSAVTAYSLLLRSTK